MGCVKGSEEGVVREAYTSDQEFFADVDVLFANCHLSRCGMSVMTRYNQNPDCAVVTMCNALEDVYRQKRDQYEAKLAEMNDLIACFQNDNEDDVRCVQWFLLISRYLVKWTDLSYKDCTWEKRDVITDKEMIEAYEQRQRVPEWKLAPLKSKAERVMRGEKSMLTFKEGKVGVARSGEE